MRSRDERASAGGKLREHPDWADRMIANKLGCDHETVGAVRAELEATGGIRQFDRLLGEDGKRRVKRRQEARAGRRPPRLLS